MSIFVNAIAALFVLALLGALAASGFFAYDLMTAALAEMGPTARIAAGAGALALLAAFGIAGGIRRAIDRNRAAKLTAEKSATYRLFVELWESLSGASERRQAPEFRKDLRALDLMLALYGSPAVIKAHNTLRALELDTRVRGQDLRPHFIKALAEVRKDLGSGTQGLASAELEQLLQPASGIAHAPAAAKGSPLGETASANS